MNSHSTQILALIVISGLAIAGARGAGGRLLALLFIVALMAGGLALGFVIRLGETAVMRDNLSVSMMIVLGLMGAAGCIFRNRRRSHHSWPFTNQ